MISESIVTTNKNSYKNNNSLVSLPEHSLFARNCVTALITLLDLVLMNLLSYGIYILFTGEECDVQRY